VFGSVEVDSFLRVWLCRDDTYNRVVELNTVHLYRHYTPLLVPMKDCEQKFPIVLTLGTKSRRLL
jgi:hypothetical protein